MANLGVVKRPKRGSKAAEIVRRLDEIEPQEEIDMDWPRNVAIVSVSGPTEAKEVRSLWHNVVREYTLSTIGTKFVRWPNGDCEVFIWRKT